MALTEIDRNLLKRCLAEEPGAWKDFVDRFIGLFIHVIGHVGDSRSVKLSSDDIDDLCAEVFVSLLADDFAILRRFRGQSSLATYLTVIARRIVVKEVSRRRQAEALGHVNAHQCRDSLAVAALRGTRRTAPRHESPEQRALPASARRLLSGDSSSIPILAETKTGGNERAGSVASAVQVRSVGTLSEGARGQSATVKPNDSGAVLHARTRLAAT